MRLSFRAHTLAVLFALSFSLCFAQGKPVAVIEYSSGSDVIIIRDNRKLAFADPIGVDLVEGDQIQTGRAVLLELRLIQNAAIIKLAENTTFLLEKSVADGKTVLRVVYGRVRAKVEKLSGAQSFYVVGSNAVAGVRGTDFGFEIVAPRLALSSVPLTKVFCFEGALAVTAYEQTNAGAAERLEALSVDYVVAAGEMVLVQKVAEKDESSKITIDGDTKTFWEKNDFKVSDLSKPLVRPSVDKKPEEPVVTELAPVPSVKPETTISPADDGDVKLVYVPDMEFAQSLRLKSRLKDSGVLGALVLSTAGLGLEAYSLYVASQGKATEATQFRMAAAILGASAVPFLVFSLVIQP